MKTALFEPRWYRTRCHVAGLEKFLVRYRESDLCIQAESDLSPLTRDVLVCVRSELEVYISGCPEFGRSLSPLPLDEHAPGIARSMSIAALKTGVGPMAAVAGAINHAVAMELKRSSSVLIIENGGDIYARAREPVITAIYAGDSPLSMKIGLKLDASGGVGICTSSGTVGHSLSFGRADAVTVVADDCALADAAATAIANLVTTADDINIALDSASRIPGINGTIIIKGDRIGAWGDDLELVKL